MLSLLVARDGATWVGAEQRLSRITGAGAETFTMTPSHPLRRVSALAEDASGAIWTGSPEAFPGAWVLDGGRWSHFRLPPPYEAMDFAAWMEVYLGGRWHAFDPRNNAPRIGRIKIAHGRDAADVPLTHTFGPNTLAGFRVPGRPVFAVQYHPEASPGPHDSSYLFDEFVDAMDAARGAKGRESATTGNR